MSVFRDLISHFGPLLLTQIPKIARIHGIAFELLPSVYTGTNMDPIHPRLVDYP
jgi:hypothetical protein